MRAQMCAQPLGEFRCQRAWCVESLFIHTVMLGAATRTGDWTLVLDPVRRLYVSWAGGQHGQQIREMLAL